MLTQDPKSDRIDPRPIEIFRALAAAFGSQGRQAILDLAVELKNGGSDSTEPPIEQKNINQALAGWLAPTRQLGEPFGSGTDRSQVLDYCKRVEYCYAEYVKIRRNLPKAPYIDFKATERLAYEIIEAGGLDALDGYTRHLEAVFTEGSWQGLDRPERMREHWLSYQKRKTQPASH